MVLDVIVFLDTNVLISAILNRDSTPARAYRLACSDPNQAVICEQNLHEIRRVFAQKFPSKQVVLERFIASLEEAINDGNLVPYKVFKADSLYLRAGVRYEDLSPEEKVAWDAQDWGSDEDGGALDPPETVEAGQINRAPVDGTRCVGIGSHGC